MRVLAIDYGTKRIGVASGDSSVLIAFAKGMILNKGNDFVLTELQKFIDLLGTQKIIVGLPLNMSDGHQENHVMKHVRLFVDFLSEKLADQGIEVELFDERLSSFEADGLISSHPGHKNEKFNRDAYSAQVILQRYFDTI